jgi:hypothetical protein
MANPTSNFGWQMPTPVDLVTDLPADFEVFGQAVDSSLADLKGGTSGQVLSKNSNTDMDFVWVTSDDANAIQNAIVDAKGDLIAATAADTPARLAVGTNYNVLSAQSGETTGLLWAGGVTAFTPTWTADVGSPSIGNGQLAMYYIRFGKMCHVRLFFQGNTTTTYGTSGGWYFSLPFTAATGTNASMAGNFYMEDFAVAGYRGFAAMTSDGTRLGIVTALPNTSQGVTNPFTWGTNDFIAGSFVYEVA